MDKNTHNHRGLKMGYLIFGITIYDIGYCDNNAQKNMSYKRLPK